MKEGKMGIAGVIVTAAGLCICGLVFLGWWGALGGLLTAVGLYLMISAK